MANMKVVSLRKGIPIGRIGQALSELHIEVDVSDEIDLEKSRGALGEIKNSLKPLKKNFRTSPEEVRKIGEGVQKITKLLKGKPTPETKAFVKAELREVREHFRKVVQTGFADCGAPNMSDYQKADLVQDNAYYSDTHPESFPDISK